MIDWTDLTLFIYITARMSGFVLFNPLIGRNNIPGIFKAGLVLVLAITTVSFENQQIVMPESFIAFALCIILEMAIGFLLGMIVNFFFYIPQVAGQVIDSQMGMTMNQVYDPGSQANMSMTGTFINIMMVVLFFAANGHHTLFRIMMTSGDILPYGTASISNEAARTMLLLFVECSVLGIKLCLPVLAAEFIGEMGMGVLLEVIPQINVFAINIDLKVIIGWGMVFILITPFSEFLLDAESYMLTSLRNALVLTAST